MVVLKMPALTLTEYLEKNISSLARMVPDLSSYEDELKGDAIIYHLQRLTMKVKADLDEANKPDTDAEPTTEATVYEEHQIALLLLDESKITKAFNVASGYFEEISHCDVLASEEAYLNHREKTLNTIAIAKKESSCCGW